MDELQKTHMNELKIPKASVSSAFTTSSPASVHPSAHDSQASAGQYQFMNSGSCRVPRCPYIVGATFTAISHEPSVPFGHDYITKYPKLPDNWEKLSQLDSCLSRPFLGGRSITHATRTLTITSTIRSGYGRGAQILVINNNMVAKIYDPLYYKFINEYNYTEPVICDADGDYLREAAAYTELQSSPAAVETTPIYHGSFTVETDTYVTPSGGKEKRVVPLILIEYLRGQSMSSIKPHTLSDEVRSAITRKVIVAEIVILHAGVDHYDYCPRNIMLLNLDESPSTLTEDYINNHVQVKVIDFNISIVKLTQVTNTAAGIKATLRQGENHIPKSTSAEEWLWEQFHGDERFRPVTWDPKNPLKSPKYLDDSEDDSSGSSDSGISMGTTE
ncbi:hypothetical protein HBI56_130970 [Parastagonospora nodorum]|nr:hypothetical protein HBI09_134700 [Parastagonospora nodorum]KAH4257183.1 hypothetical protein HBI03_159910 [Parastagonospora nodorum]KAH4270059.1 hypothetical protein HBI04_154910 [Parastagonospora nodorum]KAH4420492.1 hypothetical protein HBH92_035150 [Parastagonospora nodorum]KAH4452773.1 hypothetical protein HBH93_032640 [Parastagonospora nodorum]